MTVTPPVLTALNHTEPICIVKEKNPFCFIIRTGKVLYLSPTDVFYKSLQIGDVLVTAQVYLGQALFRQAKYAESVGPYEKVREMERSGNKLSSDQHRIVVDQLSMAYGISGDLKKARALLEDAIRQDPEYPINY